MIKNLLIVLLVTCSIMAVSAQSLVLDPSPASVSMDLGDVEAGDVAVYSYLTNNSAATKTVSWTRVVNSLQPGWVSAICIGDNCFIPSVSTGQFEIEANSTSDVSVHIYPGGSIGAIDNMVPGTADIDIIITCVEDPNDSVTGNFGFELLGASSAEDLTEKSVYLFPNPAKDFFQISNPQEVGMIEIYNLVGRKVKEYNVLPGNQYSVNDLNNGIYLVKLLTDGKTVVKTISLATRR